MSEWKEYKFTEVATLTNGRAYLQPELQSAGKYKIVRVGNLSGGDKWFYSDMELPVDKYCNKGDLLYAWACSFGPYIWEGDKTIYHYHIWKVDVNSDVADRFFLYYYLKYYTPKWMGLTNGSVMMHITKGSLEKQIIHLPPLETQKNIASILSSLDDKIAVNRRICENLEAQAQALFKHWFIDFAPFKNGKFVESELGMIPEGWRVGTLGEICKTNKRTLSSKNTPDVIEYLDTGNITANRIDNIQILHKGQDKIPSRAKRLVSEGDIIFSAVRPNQRHYGLLMNPSPSLVVSTGFVVITANWSAYRYFIYRFLIQNSIIETLQAIGEQSVSTYPSINANDIESLKLIIPKMEDVEDFADICCNFYSKIESIEDESTRLSTLRDTLLPKLMSGQIKV